MRYCSKKKVKTLLQDLGIIPSKRLGQNFLISSKKAKEILSKLEPELKGQKIVEIGPGLGCFTFELERLAEKLLLIEKDKRIAEFLAQNLNPHKTQIVVGDALSFFSKIPWSDYLLFSNLPFNISKRLLVQIILNPAPKKAYLGLQKEVAEKLLGHKKSPLSLGIELHYTLQKLTTIPSEFFYPRPEVEVTFISLYKKPYSFLLSQEKFWQFLKLCFKHPRKKLVKVLKKELKLEKKSLALFEEKLHNYEECRPEDLALKDYLFLYLFLSSCLS